MKIKITLSNSAGELDSFVTDVLSNDEGLDEISDDLERHLRNEWLSLAPGDTITITEAD